MNRAKRRDTAQNIIITLLALSAMFLFSQTQFFHLGAATGRTYFGSAPSSNSTVGSTSAADDFSTPVRLMITDEYSHIGSVALTTSDETFLPLKSLLAEALGSARPPAGSSREAFLDALQQPSVFFDFLHELPLSYLAELCDAAFTPNVSARYLLISQQEDGICLFLWDDNAQVQRCATALQSGSLPLTSDHPALNSVFLASEWEDSHEISHGVFFPESLPTLNTLSASKPAQDDETLLSAFQFNPYTNSRYTEAGGSEVVIDGERTLRLQQDGSIVYQGGSQSDLYISHSQSPSVREQISGTYALLCRIADSGDARLYVDSIRQTGQQLNLTFSYQLGGIPIRLSDNRHAAAVTLHGGTVTGLTFYPRQYTLREEVSHLLPLTQAIAVADAQGNRSLYIGYADRGGETAPAVWLAD